MGRNRNSLARVGHGRCRFLGVTNLGDVGGWFRTATGAGAPAWGPAAGDFGRVSPQEDLTAALGLFRGRPTVVVTGAGMSTGSGLPDYRGRDSVPRSPMTFQEFTGSDSSRRRYWARSTVGWNWFEAARPGEAHLALAELGRRTPLTGIVTQNVDGLHQAAGSAPVVDLHGHLARVVCLGCGAISSRADLQRELLALNPAVAARLGELSERARTSPDGDAEVEGLAGFAYPECRLCGGMLKPDVVYFGENVRRDVVEASNALYDAAEAVLVLGSSLTVMSGLRFVRRAAREGKDVVIAGDGPTRGDGLAAIRVHGRLEHILARWAEALQQP